jgi:hypothetical protein
MVQWSVSLPPAAQYAKGHMLNVKAENVRDLGRMVDDLLESDDLIQKLGDLAAQVVATQVVADTFKSDDKAQGERREERTESSGSGEIYTCEHGKREFRSGNRNGKAWAAYFCPLKKGDPNQCDPVWA